MSREQGPHFMGMRSTANAAARRQWLRSNGSSLTEAGA